MDLVLVHALDGRHVECIEGPRRVAHRFLELQRMRRVDGPEAGPSGGMPLRGGPNGEALVDEGCLGG